MGEELLRRPPCECILSLQDLLSFLVVDAVDGSSAYLVAYNKLSQRTRMGCQCKDFFSYTAENGSVATAQVCAPE